MRGYGRVKLIAYYRDIMYYEMEHEIKGTDSNGQPITITASVMVSEFELRDAEKAARKK